MRSLVRILFIFIYIPLASQVNFEFLFDIEYPENNSSLSCIQMIDVDSDEQLDIVLFYESDGNIIVESYNTNGEFISEKFIAGNNAWDAKGWLVNHNNNIILIGEYTFEYELMIKLIEFNTNTVLDSIIINQSNYYELFSPEITDLKVYSNNGELVILAGISNLSGVIILETVLLRFMYIDSLQYDQLIQNSGERIYDFPESDYLITTGYYYATLDYSSSITRYLNFISKTDYLTLTAVNQSSGTSWENTVNHWPAQFIILNANDIHYNDYGFLMQKIVLDSDGDSVHFLNYYPDDINLNWSSDSTLIGHNLITSSTCVTVNNENHYVMYFRENQMEIRNRINGEIVHHQVSEINPCNIEMDSSNELLFFVNNDNNEILSIYKLDSGIYVSSDKNQIQINNNKLLNFPNPFNPSTTIEFSIQNDSKVDLSIYNIKGQKIKTLVRNNISNGDHSIIWYGDNESGKFISSGIYFYKLKVNGKTEAVKKCLLLK